MSIVTHVSNHRDACPVPKLATEVITRDEEMELIALIERCDPQNYPGDSMGGLRAISYGWHYNLESETFAPCEPAPAGFGFARDVAARFAGLPPEDFVQILLNRYAEGAEIPWHCDKPIWQDVVGLSLGTESTMCFRMPVDDGYEYTQAQMAPRSMYLLTGVIRELCDHSIPPVKEPRWSITFRTLSAEGKQLRDALSASG